MSEWIPNDEWATIVKHVPIVSVDLVVLVENGVVLGKRQNEPAKGEWFVPGGRVHKHETLHDAVHRIAREELGIEVEIVEELGVYEHFYEEADVSNIGGKHYLANGFVVRTNDGAFVPDEQHSTMQVFDELPPNLHPYVVDYLDAASVSGIAQ